MKKIKVYIASPYTVGDQIINVRTQMLVFEALHSCGMMPFAPLWGAVQNLFFPLSWAEWLVWCTTWVKSCDCLLRLPGESKGADEECVVAEKAGIPVFYSLEDLKKAYYAGEIITQVEKTTELLISTLEQKTDSEEVYKFLNQINEDI